MTLEEAIIHAENVSASCEGQCSDDHRQLAKWLTELKNYRHKYYILGNDLVTKRNY